MAVDGGLPGAGSEGDDLELASSLDLVDPTDDLGTGTNSSNGDGATTSLRSFTLQESSALFLMGLREKHKLTQVALQGVVDGATGLMQRHISSLHAQVFRNLRMSGTSEATINSICSIFSDDGPIVRPFYGLETQLSFYRKHFQLT